jgi:hypothetical protein
MASGPNFCSTCGSEKQYNDEYDSYYCELCNKWLEEKCNDSECGFCTTRPEKPITVHAKQINEPFRVDTLEGDYKQGKPGDYLMRGIDGELYICDKDIFERTYDWTEQ